ncbi:hypothetical protein [Subtercola lobariae]|uniref:DUF7847 domain-containing protein n=1 Tax=Subtercola lobariae TaxID=1588641 RepID=A0A917B1C3_9MICO|nr:hypothetical protein [Subtercola lobariae]GGF14398.1 hypothetical protein GCM10011399_05290 [Subtercola lobariae]
MSDEHEAGAPGAGRAGTPSSAEAADAQPPQFGVPEDSQPVAPAAPQPAAQPVEPPRYGEYAPPPQAPHYGSPPPQYGQYAPPPPPPPYDGYPPPPQYGQYAPPPAQYGGYPPPPGQYPAPPAGPPGPGGANWAPPPKPGLVPLRPLGFGTLLGAPFQVLRRNPGPTFGSALIIQFAIYLVSVGVIGGATLFAFNRVSQASVADRNSIAAGSVVIVLLSALIPVALALISSALLQGILVIEVSREVLGEKRKLGELWRAAAKRMWPLVLWILLEGIVVVVVLAIAVGIVVAFATIGGAAGIALAVISGLLFALGLTVLAVWITTKVSLVACAIVLEGLGARAAIARSWRLTSGSFWKTFGTEALVYLIVYVASLFVTQPVSLILGLAFGIFSPNDTSDSGSQSAFIAALAINLIVGVLQIVFGAISAVVQAAAISLIYVDLRMRKEGLDLELIRFVEAQQAGLVTADDDPYRVQRPL